jgi:hypothetical protein
MSPPWLASLLLPAVLIVGATVVTVRTIAVYRSFRRAVGTIVRALELVVDRAASRPPREGEELGAARVHLDESLATLRTISRAFARARAPYTRLRATVPRK